MKQEDYRIPRTLDDPGYFLIFQFDTAMVFLVVFLMCVAFNIIAALLLALIVVKIYVQLKENGDRGLVKHLIYWYLPSELWISPYWVSSKREFGGR